MQIHMDTKCPVGKEKYCYKIKHFCKSAEEDSNRLNGIYDCLCELAYYN